MFYIAYTFIADGIFASSKLKCFQMMLTTEKIASRFGRNGILGQQIFR